MAQARACCVSKMFLLFPAKLLLSVVRVLLLPCLGQGGEEAGSPVTPLYGPEQKYSIEPGALKCHELRKDKDFFSCLWEYLYLFIYSYI